MKYPRRDFIKFGGLALGILPVLTGRGFGQSDLTPDTLLLQNAESFQRLIGSQFTFYRKNSAVSVVLIEVGIYRPTQKKFGAESFSLVFEMPTDEFEQENYQMFHPSIGSFELLSVPGKSSNGTPLLIAVINRI